MYRVVLVDDEMPALNYLNAIFQKYLPDFEVAGLFGNAQTALNSLAAQTVDVLITDINMPGGMNGIELAKTARAKYPSLHIIIVSGYSEFEYARGALQAGVEDYLLKPISITKVREVMEKEKMLLDEEQLSLRQKVFSAVINQRDFKQDALRRSFGTASYYFAVVRFGNLNNNRYSSRTSDAVYPLSCDGWLAFYGRDDEELILLRSSVGHTGRFSQELSDVISRIAENRLWTAVHEVNAKAVQTLPAFLKKAYRLLNSSLIIGVSQCLPITAPPPANFGKLPNMIKQQLSAYLAGSSWRDMQELFLSTAVKWEQEKLPQEQVEQMCDQLIAYILNENSTPDKNQKAIVDEATSLYSSAGSVGELLSGLYEVLFGELSLHDKKISGKELCQYTLDYIKDNYAMPLNIQTVCAKIGFSQTYLSRLLRKYADTSVNNYLTQCRMEAAKKLLKENPEMLLRNVALAVGYEDQSYFNKIFRNETGLTPKQYAAQFDEYGQGSDE